MKAVVTISIGDKFRRIAELTHPRMERYAQSIGADFISLNRFAASPHLEKFRLSDFLAVYDRILFLDTDIVINKNCPDIFTQVAEDRFGAWFPDAMIPGRFSEQIKRVQAVLGEIGWAKDYFNSGVMVISRIHRPIFAAPPNYSDEFYEQTLLNYRVQQGHVRTFDLGYKWNHTGVVNSALRMHSHFIHYAGLSHVPPGGELIDQIGADIRCLETQ